MPTIPGHLNRARTHLHQAIHELALAKQLATCKPRDRNWIQAINKAFANIQCIDTHIKTLSSVINQHNNRST